MQPTSPSSEPRVVLSFDNIPPSVRRRIVDAARAALLASSTELNHPTPSPHAHRQVTSLFADGSLLDRDPGTVSQNEIPCYSVPSPPQQLHSKTTHYIDSHSSPASSAEPTCWNCGKTGHRIGDCSLPRDEEHIAAARPARRDRYFASSEKQAKYAHFKAGQLSPELRTALGLAPGQLPEWVYRWQTFGPPPYARKATQDALEANRQREELTHSKTKRVDAQGDVEMESERDGTGEDNKEKGSHWADLQRILRTGRSSLDETLTH